MKEYGLDALALVRAVEKLTGESLGLTEDDLQAVRLEPTRSSTKAEDL
jgi:transketolase